MRGLNKTAHRNTYRKYRRGVLMKNDIGLKHIALELKISLVAVSRALKDYDDISEITKHKVRQKAIELGYVPRPVDKIKHKIIAVFVDSLVSPMFGIITEKMIEELKKKNYLIILIPTAKNYVSKENVKEALKLSVDAMISFLIPHDNAYEIALLHRVPFLLFGRYDERPKLNVVCMDDEQGGQLAASYLIDECHATKLCYIGVDDIECSARRQQGFLEKAEQTGIKDVLVLKEEQMREVSDLIEKGYHWFFCFDDNLANYLYDSQKSKDIHVIGFNGISNYSQQFEFIASINADYDQMVHEAVEILMQKIACKNEGEPIIKKYQTKLCKKEI